MNEAQLVTAIYDLHKTYMTLNGPLYRSVLTDQMIALNQVLYTINGGKHYSQYSDEEITSLILETKLLIDSTLIKERA